MPIYTFGWWNQIHQGTAKNKKKLLLNLHKCEEHFITTVSYIHGDFKILMMTQEESHIYVSNSFYFISAYKSILTFAKSVLLKVVMHRLMPVHKQSVPAHIDPPGTKRSCHCTLVCTCECNLKLQATIDQRLHAYTNAWPMVIGINKQASSVANEYDIKYYF